MDAFLKEQLERIQELTKRMSRFEARAAELSEELERNRRRFQHGPLQEIRDFRHCSGMRNPSMNIDSAPRRSRRRRRKR